MKSLDEPERKKVAEAKCVDVMWVDIAIINISELVRPQEHYQLIPRL